MEINILRGGEMAQVKRQSLAKKLKGNNGTGDQFVDEVRKYGLSQTMDKWQISWYDLANVQRFLREETGDEHFGLHSLASLCDNEGIQRILRTLIIEIANFAIRNNKERERLTLQLEAYRTSSQRQTIDFLDGVNGVIDLLKVS